MKAGPSGLNPYAESYVPLSKRGTTSQNKEHTYSPKESQARNDAASFGQLSYNSLMKDQVLKVSESYSSVEHHKQAGLPSYGFYGSSSHTAVDMTEKAIVDEEFEMDLAYLLMTFPGISDETLSEVYLANRCDLDAAIDMLNQLELYSDSSEKLPDTLDIGDVAEPGSTSDRAAHKVENVGSEIGASSSKH